LNSSESRAWPSVARGLTAGLCVVALLAGSILRLVRLDRVPLGWHPDELCNLYDAYSILTTGRDQWNNFLPLAFKAFGDYRMPLFNYSLVPLTAIFGLNPIAVRLCAAIWGIADLGAVIILAGLTLGLPGAAAAAVVGALSPWHLVLSRHGIETISADTMTTLAMLSFVMWLEWRRDRWLLLSAILFGLSLYSYSIVKAFLPPMIGVLSLTYWRELNGHRRTALMALGIVALLALPQAMLFWTHPEMRERFRVISILSVLWRKGLRLESFGANFMGYFTPSFLFVTGDRGDHWTMLHPAGFGQLLPEQAPLILLAVLGFFNVRRRKFAILMFGWLICAAVPAMLTVPLGAFSLEKTDIPTASVLFDYSSVVGDPNLEPAVLLSHPDSRHDALAMAPWTVVSALGFVTLLELLGRKVLLVSAAAALLLAGVIFHGARFCRTYFGEYVTMAAPYFQYGAEEAARQIKELDDGKEILVITRRISEGYIYILVFGQYPPEWFQRIAKVKRPWSTGYVLTNFGRYYFVSPYAVYEAVAKNAAGELVRLFAHGIFVFTGNDLVPAPPKVVIRYPDGTIAYRIVVK